MNANTKRKETVETIAADLKRNVVLTAGPSISTVEIDLVAEAVTEGWNTRHSEFLHQLQKEFAAYIGTRFAMATSSCTGALHLSLSGLGLKAGDEVIVPDVTWVASGFSPTYVGATPVFADINEKSLCLSAESVAKNITPRTKAIIPVHLYGHPTEMTEIMELAKKHKIHVIEDAAPSIGATWKGKRTGSFGTTSAFSFQGAKLMVSGEGGMLCTDDEELFKKVQYLNDYAVDKNRSFWISEIGFKYRMSNIQAALALGQLRRIEELVERKRLIFSWYQERLSHRSELTLCTEVPGARSNYWMGSFLFREDARIDTEKFRADLREKKVDTRPFFHPMSNLPMFKAIPEKNPVAYSVAKRGINLPSGHNLTEDDVDYVCAMIETTLGKPSPRKKTGPIAKLLLEKNKAVEQALSIPFKGGSLKLVTYASLDNASEWKELLQAREKLTPGLKVVKNQAEEETKTWLFQEILNPKDRALFWILDGSQKVRGIVGISKLSLDSERMEIDNIASLGSNNVSALADGIRALADWQRDFFGVKASFARIFSSETETIRLFESLGFQETIRFPVKKAVQNGSTQWREVVKDPYHECERYLVTLKRKSG